MNDLFDILETEDQETGRKSVRLALRLSVAGNQTFCPVSGPCDSSEALEEEFRSLLEALEQTKRKAQEILGPQTVPAGLPIDPDASPGDVWSFLSSLPDEGKMVRGFNKLDPAKRQAVAEHVLTHANIFSGRGAVFSSRYNAETGRMD